MLPHINAKDRDLAGANDRVLVLAASKHQPRTPTTGEIDKKKTHVVTIANLPALPAPASSTLTNQPHPLP